MTDISVHDFHREVNCVYDGKQYSVRDNGAVTFEDRQYVHESNGAFFEKVGAEKALCLAQGRQYF